MAWDVWIGIGLISGFGIYSDHGSKGNIMYRCIRTVG